MMQEKNDANSWLGEFYPVYFSFVGGKKGAEFYHSYKREKPWVWNECGLTFFKLTDDTMKFVIRRHKSIELSYDPKTRGIKNGNAKKNSNLKQKPSQYNLRYFIEFEVPLKNLSSKIKTANKALDNYGNSPEKESWLIELDEHHHVWRPKNTDYPNDDILSNLSKDLEKKKNGSCISDTLSFVTPPSNNNELIPVVCHPARDFNVNEVEHKNYIKEVHIYNCKESKKIHATIVFAGERLRKHWFLYYVYKVFRLLAYGRTYDIESFNIIPSDKNQIKFDFPNIYSENNNIYADNIHKNRCAVDARYYLDSGNHPLLFVNTANHAMAESDSNHYKWKIEYLPWENDCPIFLGREKRCDIEKRLRVLTINPLLFRKCDESRYTCCSEK